MCNKISTLVAALFVTGLVTPTETTAQEPMSPVRATVTLPITGPVRVSLNIRDGKGLGEIHMDLGKDVTVEIRVSEKGTEAARQIGNEMGKLGDKLAAGVEKITKELGGVEQQKALDKLFDQHDRTVKALLSGLLIQGTIRVVEKTQPKLADGEQMPVWTVRMTGELRKLDPSGKDKGYVKGSTMVEGVARTGKFKIADNEFSPLAIDNGATPIIISGKLAKDHVSAKGRVRVVGSLRVGEHGIPIMRAETIGRAK